MKKMNLYGMPDAAMAGCTGDAPEQEGAENPVYGQLQHSLSELADLKRAFATSQQQLKAAQQQIETLAETNAYLRQKLDTACEKVRAGASFCESRRAYRAGQSQLAAGPA